MRFSSLFRGFAGGVMDLFLREATERIGPQGYDSLDLFKSVLDWPMARSE